jgi:hypothetical protein
MTLTVTSGSGATTTAQGPATVHPCSTTATYAYVTASAGTTAQQGAVRMGSALALLWDAPPTGGARGMSGATMSSAPGGQAPTPAAHPTYSATATGGCLITSIATHMRLIPPSSAGTCQHSISWWNTTACLLYQTACFAAHCTEHYAPAATMIQQPTWPLLLHLAPACQVRGDRQTQGLCFSGVTQVHCGQ